MRWDIGIVGLGRVGASVSRALVRSGYPAGRIVATAPRTVEGRCVAASDITLAEKLDDLVANSRVLLVCVRAEQLPAVCEVSRSLLTREQTFVVFSAGVSVRRIEESLAEGERPACAVMRAVPNVCMVAGSGYTWIYYSARLKEDERVARTTRLLGNLGEVRVADTEEMLDRNSLISGTLPAFLALFLAAVADAAVSRSIPETCAWEMISASAYGTLRTLEEFNWAAEQVVNLVATPGGLASRASRHLDREGSLKEAAAEWFGSMAGRLAT